MAIQELQNLFEKLLQDKMSPEEIRRLEILLHDAANDQTAQDLIASFFEKAETEAIPTADRKIHFDDMMRRALTKETESQVLPIVHRVHFLRRWGWAAAVLILTVGIATAIFVASDRQSKLNRMADLSISDSSDILPGTNKALLTLSDGTVITLDSAANGAIAQQGNSSIIKTANGEIRYDLEGTSHDEVMMNTMTTPIGGQYQVTLPDGTRVWLNAASSITYPAAFPDSERKIKVTGEVYLEVARNKAKPFRVDVAGKSIIEVLGTSFNVNSYADETNIKTTLIAGSVRVLSSVAASSDRLPNTTVILKPGQQAQIRNTSAVGKSSGQPLEVVNADISQTLAWKNGIFDFTGADLRSVMRQLERWYDIRVVYEGPISNEIFGGEMYRNVNLSNILSFLKESGLKFRLEGKNLIVL